MRVVVVGAGAIGLSSAFFLASRGAGVTVLDARGIGSGASRTNAGWIVPAMSGPVPSPGMIWKSARWMLQRQSPLKIKPSLDPAFVSFMLQMLKHCNARDYEHGLRATVELNRRTFELFDLLTESGVQFEQHRAGVTSLFLSDDALHEHVIESRDLEALGVSTPEVLTSADVRRESPAVSSRVRGGIKFADQRFLDPDSFVEGLHAACVRLGVDFRLGEQATELVRVGNRAAAVRATQTYAADAFVLATGAWSSRLGATLGVRVPIQPGKGYGFDLPSSPEIGGALYLAEGKVAVTPLATKLRMAGTMEFTTEERMDRTRAAGIIKTAGRYLDLVTPATAVPWSGLRPMTPDGLPIVSFVGDLPNVVVAAGHCMLGVTLAPVTGDVVAKMLLRGYTPAEARPFGIDRFAKASSRSSRAIAHP